MFTISLFSASSNTLLVNQRKALHVNWRLDAKVKAFNYIWNF